MSGPEEMWVSDGLPSAALQRLNAEGRSVRRFPLVGGVTVWDDPPEGEVTAAVACPNRLGVFEPLAARPWWERLWWWADPLSPDSGGYRLAPRVERITAPAPLPAHRTVADARRRSLRAADYLTRRLRHLRGVRIPSPSHGRRFPFLVPVNPFPRLAGVAEELRVPRPVDGWPGLVVCEVGWWQSTERLDSLVAIISQAVGGERPATLRPDERVWSSPGP